MCVRAHACGVGGEEEVGVPFKGFLKHILTFYDFRQLIYICKGCVTK